VKIINNKIKFKSKFLKFIIFTIYNGIIVHCMLPLQMSKINNISKSTQMLYTTLHITRSGMDCIYARI
jgi:hypothetical protein